MSFLPDNYEPPITGKYMKFQIGANRFRILSDAILGMVYWVAGEGTGRKPIRKRAGEKINQSDLEVNPETGEIDQPKHFWAFVVYSYSSKSIQILEVTQMTIQDQIRSLANDDGWGDPKGFDITVTRVTKNDKTSYTTMPRPKSDVDPSILSDFMTMRINLDALFSGGDPFAANGVAPASATPRPNGNGHTREAAYAAFQRKAKAAAPTEVGTAWGKLVKRMYPNCKTSADLMAGDWAIVMEQIETSIDAKGEYVTAPDLEKQEFKGDDIPFDLAPTF